MTLESLITQARKKGSPQQFHAWVQTQPSVMGTGFDWIDGQSRNEACHVRRAGSSGIAYKEDYCVIPMRSAEHRHQHQHGERAAILKFTGFDVSAEEAKVFFNEKRVETLKRWIAS